ncbi:MAG: ABC transporter permease [Vicinamibacterales bacterium]
MSTFLQDFRYAWRMMGRYPGFTVVAVLTLALGIGMTTAMLSVVDAVLVRPVPFANAERLLMIWETDRASDTTHEPASFPDFLDFQRRSRQVSEFGGFVAGEANFAPDGGEPSRIAMLLITDGFLTTLGIKPALGRPFNPEEDQPGGGDVVLISEKLWDRVFLRDPGIIGRRLRLDDRPRTIVGVLPASADFGILQILRAADYSRGFADRDARTSVDVFSPLQGDPDRLPRSTHPLLVVGRLADGASPESAGEELGAIAAQLEKAYPENEARGVFVQPLREVILGPVRPILLVLLFAVGLVLLIACVNVANLLLARATTRVREIAIRTALGVKLQRLVGQFVMESIVLTLTSAVLGLLLASGVLNVLLLTAPPDVPRLSDVDINLRILAVVLGISLAVGLAFGLVPILYARQTNLQLALKAEDTRSTTSGRDRGLTRSALVVSEIALAVVLVIGAGLLIKSFWRLQQVNPGFDTDAVIKAEFRLPATRYPIDFSTYPKAPEVQVFGATLLARVRALPGIESAALAASHPLDAGFTNSFAIAGREAEARDWPEISIRQVSPGYFRTLRIPLLQGRLLVESDDLAAPAVVLVNQEVVRRFFQNQDPIGQRILVRGPRTIVGVVGNEKIHGLNAPAPIAVYSPLVQTPSASQVLVLRTNGDRDAVVRAVRATVRSMDPGLALFGVEPLARTVSQSVGEQRFTMLLLGVFAALALTLAAIGIHGLLSYSVAQRTREIGIRMALGAAPERVIRLVFNQGARLTVVGLTLGLGLGWLFARSIAGLLFGITATDAATFAVVVVVLGVVALVATWLPARRAVKVDPIVALRYE